MLRALEFVSGEFSALLTDTIDLKASLLINAFLLSGVALAAERSSNKFFALSKRFNG